MLLRARRARCGVSRAAQLSPKHADNACGAAETSSSWKATIRI
jgi:hypothetical protein